MTSSLHKDALRLRLNYSNPEHLLGRHKHLLITDQVKLLEMNESRIKQWPNKFGSETYKIDSTLIAMSDVYDQEAICKCGIRNSRNQSGRCNQHRLCEACAEYRKEKALRRFRSVFSRRSWSHATLSWEDYLLVHPGSTDDIQMYWEACSVALKSAVYEGLIDGAYWGEQIHLDSLWPDVLVNPHVHAVINARRADDLGDSLAETFADCMSVFVRPKSCRIRLKPHVTLKPLDDRQYFHNCLKYPLHPPAIGHVYVRGWHKSGRVSEQRAEELNINLQEFYYALAAVTCGRQTVRYAGNMDAKRRRDYIGSR